MDRVNATQYKNATRKETPKLGVSFRFRKVLKSQVQAQAYGEAFQLRLYLLFGRIGTKQRSHFSHKE